MPIQFNRTRPARTWTFSLKGLMFLTFVVAVSAALIGASAVLAVLLLPFIVAALVRTARVRRQINIVEKQHPAQRGLFATFCQSLILIMSLVIVSSIAVFVACCAGLLILLGVVARFCQPAIAFLRGGAARVWPLVLRVWRRVVLLASHVSFGAIFLWVRDRAVNGALLLISVSRILLRRCWYPETAHRVVSTVSG
jgi:hypothetical protein